MVKYELPEEKIFDTNILSFSKKTERDPKKLFSSGSDPENKKKNDNSLKLAVIYFILLLISETILASSRIEH